MKSCREMTDLISQYIDGEMDTNGKTVFEEHLKACESCRKELEDVMTVVRLCSDIEDVELPAGFRNELHEKLINVRTEARTSNKSFFRSKYFGILTSAAAVLLVAVLFRGYLANGIFLPGSKTAQSAPMAQAADTRAAREEPANAEEVKSFQASEAAPSDDRAVNETPSAALSKASGGSEIGVLSSSTEQDNKNASYTVVTGSPQTESEKIKQLAAQNGGELYDTVTINLPDGAVDNLDTATLNIKIPRSQYQAFSDGLTEIYGASNVDQGIGAKEQAAVTDELNTKLSDIDNRINELEKGQSGAQELDTLKKDRDSLQKEIETVQNDNDYVYLTIIIK